MPGSEIASAANFTATSFEQTNSFFTGLWGEEKPESVLALLLILVFLLHVWCIMLLTRPSELEEIPVAPLIMEVSMITQTAPKLPSAAPPTPKPPPEKKPEPQKPQPKAAPKKLQTPLQKPADFAPTEKSADTKANSEPAPNQTSATSESKQKSEAAEQNTEVNCRASYISHPEPDYPAIARTREWQGTVRLRVLVSAEGLSKKVEVEESSGHEILDDAAVEIVKTKWRFALSAKCGDSWVIVPIKYSLINSDD